MTAMSQSFFAFLLLLATFSPATAKAFPRACTREHLVEAIELNLARRQDYANLSNGQSLPISDALIDMEKRLLKSALLADFVSFFFQLWGIAFLCDEYVSMSKTPAFTPQSPKPWPQLSGYTSWNADKAIETLTQLNEKKDFTKILEVSEQWLQDLNSEKQFHCLTRHFLESVARAAVLAPRHNTIARERLFIPTLGLSAMFIKGHIDLLKEAEQLDRSAAPLQARGIAIICQDVPPIPIPQK